MLDASPATLDRLLREHRTRPAARPRSGSEVRRQVSLREHRPTATDPGWIHADTVFHCGTSTRGSFACSLTMVCIFSQWSVLRATWNHSDLAIHTRIAEEEKRLPFPLLGIHTVLRCLCYLSHRGVQGGEEPGCSAVNPQECCVHARSAAAL